MKDLPTLEELSAEALMGQVLDEFLDRQNRGEQPDVEEYVSRYPQLASVLRQMLPALPLLRPVDSAFATSAGAPDAAEAVSGTLGDFRILREVGRGGMGVVYEAEQISLGRRVALKVLPFASALDARHLQRFKNEAQAAALLHHPNIVPVHAVGCERGVHYYAMQFIEGQSLAAVVRELRSNDEGRMTNDERRTKDKARMTKREDAHKDRASETPVGLRHSTFDILSSLGIRHSSFHRAVAQLGVQAAEALEHAHTEGIIHRDIKPANLLVDGHGKLWVADFGLARVRSDAALTMTGDLLGTLRYMSPEQALAKRELIDHRTDIYALGATLYELLILEPAVPGTDREEVLQHLEHREPRPPRQLKPAIPVDLETIILKAMARAPHERYATAQELANDLRCFLEDQPIRARRPNLGQRMRKWARRHRAVVGAGLVLLAMAVVGWAVATVLIVRAQRLAEEHAAEAERQRHAAEQALAEVERQRHRAVQQQMRAHDAVDYMYTHVAERWLSEQPHLEPLHRDFLQRALKHYQEYTAEQPDNPGLWALTAQSYRRMGDLQDRLGKDHEAEESYTKAIALMEKVVALFPQRIGPRYDLARSQNQLAKLYLSKKGRIQDAEAVLHRAVGLLEVLVTEDPGDPFLAETLVIARHRLGQTFLKADRLPEAEKHYRLALERAEKMPAEKPNAFRQRHALTMCLDSLAVLLQMTLRHAESEKLLRRALEIRAGMAAEAPTNTQIRNDLATTCNNLARLLQRTLRTKEALEKYRQGTALLERLAADFPRVPEYRFRLGATQVNLGAALSAAGADQEAEQVFQSAITLNRRLLAEGPSVPDYCSSLALALHHTAQFRLKHTEPKAAQTLLEEAAEAQDKAFRLSPQQPLFRQRLQIILHHLGQTSLQLQDHAAAAACADRYARMEPPKSDDLKAAADLLTRCVALVEKDAKVSPEQRAALMKKYQDDAQKCLERARTL